MFPIVTIHTYIASPLGRKCGVVVVHVFPSLEYSQLLMFGYLFRIAEVFGEKGWGQFYLFSLL